MRLSVPAALGLIVLFSLAPGCRQPEKTDPRLEAPLELARAAEALGLTSVFTTPRLAAALRAQNVKVAPASADEPAAATTALQNPREWRRLDRAARYDGVLLAGSAGEFQPLLTHLVESPDFRLVRVDCWGALFARGKGGENPPYVPPAPSAVGKDLPSDRERGRYLARMALVLHAVGETSAAPRYAAAALDEAPRDAPVLVATAALALAEKNYPAALEHARRALEQQPGDPGALEVTARALAAAGAHDQAWLVASELKSRAPADDPNVLFLHARLANAARAFGEEQASLERLVALAERQGLPATDYRVYLGQSYARQGLARPALRQLELAVQDPTLSPTQRADLQTAIATIHRRAGPLSE